MIGLVLCQEVRQLRIVQITVIEKITSVEARFRCCEEVVGGSGTAGGLGGGLGLAAAIKEGGDGAVELVGAERGLVEHVHCAEESDQLCRVSSRTDSS